MERRAAGCVAGINFRAAVKEDADVRLDPENRRGVERRLAILVVLNVGALGEQQFGDGRFPPRQRHRIEERRAPNAGSRALTLAPRERGGDAGRVADQDCFEEFPVGVDC